MVVMRTDVIVWIGILLLIVLSEKHDIDQKHEMKAQLEACQETGK